MSTPELGGAIKRRWTSTIAFLAWFGIVIAGILLSLYYLTVLVPVSFDGEQAYLAVAGTVLVYIYLLLVAVGAALVFRGYRAGLILLSILAALTILASAPNLPQLADLGWGSSDLDAATRGGVDALNWRKLIQFMFVHGCIPFVLLPPVVGAVFAWLPRTLR